MASLFKGERKLGAPMRFTSDHATTYPVFEVADDLASLETRNTPDISRTGKLTLRVAFEAIADAGLDREFLRSKRVGVCMGTTVGCVMNNGDFYRAYLQGQDPDMVDITRFLRSNPADVVARELDLTGPCQTVVNACSSGTDAIRIGSLWITSGICDIVLAGGADELSHVACNGFVSLMITDSSPCKPFDRDRKGLNLGEGAAMLVLESEGTRRLRDSGARAFVLGSAASCDAHHLTAPHPDGRGLRRALEEAIASSGIDADKIAFVNAHGTGTQDNDRVESRVLHDALPGVPFLSTKGYTGHTLGAAGAIEAAFTVACLEKGRIPKSAGFSSPDPQLPASPAESELTIKGNVAVSESLAFGGHNGVLVFGTGGDPT
jgi:3-oxoacyl-[acyl-carrier-protein] synthase-1/3-oxoacyl-[acyl-carrier-protein] synthase II